MKSCKTVLTILLAVSMICAYLTPICSAQSTAETTVLNFLKDVVRLDLSQYNVSLQSHFKVPNLFPDLSPAYDEVVTYDFSCEASKASAMVELRNNEIVFCNLYSIKGPIMFANPSNGVLSAAKIFLGNYQQYSKAPYLQEMRSLLDAATELATTEKITENIKFTIKMMNGNVYLDWISRVNGTDVDKNSIGLIFSNGQLDTFSNNWNRYQVGSTELKVDQAAAIGVAKFAARNSTFVVGSETITSPQFTFVDKFTVASVSLQERSDGKLYPLWDIRLCLDRLFLSSYGGFQVLVWGDTGEVKYVTATGSLGVPDNSSVEATPEPSFSPEQTSASSLPSATVSVTFAPSSSPFASALPSQLPEQTISTSPLEQASPSSSGTSNLKNDPFGLTTVLAIAVIVITVGLALVLYKRKTLTRMV